MCEPCSTASACPSRPCIYGWSQYRHSIPNQSSLFIKKKLFYILDQGKASSLVLYFMQVRLGLPWRAKIRHAGLELQKQEPFPLFVKKIKRGEGVMSAQQAKHGIYGKIRYQRAQQFYNYNRNIQFKYDQFLTFCNSPYFSSRRCVISQFCLHSIPTLI